MGRIQVIAPLGSVLAGLNADVSLLEEILISAGHELTVAGRTEGEPAEHDLNLFLEHCGPQDYLNPYLSQARVNACFPNPEWFLPEWLPCLAHMDRILCKTRDCARIFSEYVGDKVLYTGFTSHDHYRPERKEDAIFHGPGASMYKGTEAVVACWQAQGHRLPALHLYFSELLVAEQIVDLYTHPHIVKRPGLLARNCFAVLQSRYQIHLCPSQYEGFGHYIHEAKSTGALVVTTGAPPMNEVINSEVGVLVPVTSSVPCNLGRLYSIDPQALSHAILSLDATQAKEMGQCARAEFLAMDRAFRTTFPQYIAEMIQN